MKLTIATLFALVLSACSSTPRQDQTAAYCSGYKEPNANWLCIQREKPTGGAE